MLVGIFSQVGNLDVFSRWPFITDVYAVTFDMIFIYEVRVFNAVPEQFEWLASKSYIPCQILEAEEMVNQLCHLILYKVKTDTGPVYRGKISRRESNPLVSFDGKTAIRYEHCRSQGRDQVTSVSGTAVFRGLIGSMATTTTLTCWRGLSVDNNQQSLFF